MKRKEFIQYLGWSAIGVKFAHLVTFATKPQESNRLEQLMGMDYNHLIPFENTALEKETLAAFLRMKEAALHEGVKLQIVSGFRSYQRQKQIFETKYAKKIAQGLTPLQAYQNITLYSSIPGTSRHHWGTDIDIIELVSEMPEGDLLLEKHYQKGGAFYQLSKWMKKNAHRFGFYLAYTNQKERNGFAYEPWHFSYQTVAKRNLQDLSIEDLKTKLLESNISGLNQLPEDYLNTYLKDYMYGISSELLP